MSFSLGTYGSAVFAPTPSNILPEPGDDITYDWMDVLGLFSQRFRRMATVIATVASAGSYVFDYSVLRCDYFPPLLHAYAFNSIGTQWDQYTGFESYYGWQGIDLNRGTFLNSTGASRSWLMIAYL